MEKEIINHYLNINRRRFLSRLSLGIGSVALGSLLIPDLFKGNAEETADDRFATFRTQGQTDYLFIPERRSFATGPV